MTAYVLTCDEANVVPASGSTSNFVPASCTAPYFAPQQTLLPDLSVGDGVTISVAILALWAIGFGIKAIRRTIH